MGCRRRCRAPAKTAAVAVAQAPKAEKKKVEVEEEKGGVRPLLNFDRLKSSVPSSRLEIWGFVFAFSSAA